MKESYYRKVFNTEFNLSFKIPSLDTCDKCDHLDRLYKDASTEESKLQYGKQKDLHLEKANQRYKEKRNDKLRAKGSNGCERVVAVDLQKCLPTPSLSNGQTFYLRKLWTLNLTIVDTTIEETHCMIWDEHTAARGGNEIASSIFKWFTLLPENITTVTIWSDNCPGQNRNVKLFCMYMFLLRKKPHIKIINHKYLRRGHTHT